MNLSQWFQNLHARACAKHQARMDAIVDEALTRAPKPVENRGPTGCEACDRNGPELPPCLFTEALELHRAVHSIGRSTGYPIRDIATNELKGLGL